MTNPISKSFFGALVGAIRDADKKPLDERVNDVVNAVNQDFKHVAVAVNQRRCYVWDTEKGWHEIPLNTIKAGTVFRLREPDSNEWVVGRGTTYFKADADGYTMDSGTWAVMASPAPEGSYEVMH